ncbi:mitochondrial amidoxime-reducing component 1-like [Chrysoperla carnea]|uniref:mitochondrial amidoxime-reducing component 1-like n=1 Tax=Chrysoperla carnea TaxID=189513 RepID=UPI001D08BD19|nr:mitochondrial amidoxime-reducing component 1-like [Chrysoperla carnea]
MSGQSRMLLVGIGASVGVAVIGVALWVKHRRNKLPTKWQKVGEISDLICFPIKSCAPIRETEMEATNLGLKKGLIRDRVFMVVNLEGEFVTARQIPKMVLIQPEIVGNTLTLKGPGMIDAVIDLERIHKQIVKHAVVWGDRVRAIDCGEEAARWISRYLISDDLGFRLVFYPEEEPRVTHRTKSYFPKLLPSDNGPLCDSTSYMLMTESSVTDLNDRTKRSTPIQQFRPNFVVKGTQPYEEDNWDYVKIGSDAIFRNVRPCTRCVFTTIDPETGVKDSGSEPLKTLRSYRQVEDPEIAKGEKYAPKLGIHLGLRVPGVVKLGDPIYINVN